MAKWTRIILAVIAGAAIWAALWVGGVKLVGIGESVTDTGVMLGLIGYSVLLSLLAGFVTAAAAGHYARAAVWGLALLQLAFGLIAETSTWSLMPAWYHLVFLALIVPATVIGGMIHLNRAARSFSSVS
jgi:hypothetical protein